MARKAKDLVKNQSNPNPKHSRGLLSTNVNFIKDFCEFDYISCIMPAKEIFYLSGRVINKFMSKSDYFEKSLSTKDDIQIVFSKFAQHHP